MTSFRKFMGQVKAAAKQPRSLQNNPIVVDDHPGVLISSDSDEGLDDDIEDEKTPEERRQEIQDDVYEWTRSHPRYFLLDEYIRWDESIEGGKGAASNRTLLVHLAHLFTPVIGKRYKKPLSAEEKLQEKPDSWAVRSEMLAGPPILRTVWNMLDYTDQSSLRLATRYIAADCSKWRGQDLHVRADSMYQSMILNQSSKLINFIAWNPTVGQKNGDVTLRGARITSITLTPDPRREMFRRDTIYALRNSGQNAPDEDEFQTAIENTVVHEFAVDLAIAHRIWVELLKRLKDYPLLETFNWCGHAPIHCYLAPTLTMFQRNLTKLCLGIYGLLADPTEFAETTNASQLEHVWGLTKIERDALVLSQQCKATVQVFGPGGISQDNTIAWLMHWIPRIESLEIADEYPAISQVLYKQGPAPTRELSKSQLNPLRVRTLSLRGQGDSMRNNMAFINPRHVRVLIIENCMHVGPVVESLVNAPLLAMVFLSLEMSKHITGPQAQNRYSGFRNQIIQDKRDVLDFLRAAKFKLQSLSLYGRFADETRQPRATSGLSSDLFFAVQTHLATVCELCVTNEGTDLLPDQFSEIGLCAPNLVEFRTQSRMGPRIFQEYETGENKGLTYGLKDAFSSFCKHRSLRIFCITRTVTDNFVTAGITPSQNEQVETCTVAVEAARGFGVPIQLFSYFEGENENAEYYGHHYKYSGSSNPFKGKLESLCRRYKKGDRFLNIRKYDSLQRVDYRTAFLRFLTTNENLTADLNVIHQKRTKGISVRSFNNRRTDTPYWPAAALGQPIGTKGIKNTDAPNKHKRDTPTEPEPEVRIFPPSRPLASSKFVKARPAKTPLELRFRQGPYQARGQRFTPSRYRYRWQPRADGSYEYERLRDLATGEYIDKDTPTPADNSASVQKNKMAEVLTKISMPTPPKYHPPPPRPRTQRNPVTAPNLTDFGLREPDYLPDLRKLDKRIIGPHFYRLIAEKQRSSPGGTVRRGLHDMYYYVPAGVPDPWMADPAQMRRASLLVREIYNDDTSSDDDNLPRRRPKRQRRPPRGKDSTDSDDDALERTPPGTVPIGI